MKVEKPRAEGSKLHRASQGGTAQDVASLLASGVDPDVRDASGRSALWLVSQQGFVAAMEPLLAAGAQVDCAQADGASPLFAAAHGGCDAAVLRLLEAAASPDQQRQDGSSPLLIAAQTGHAETVRVLLRYGAEVNRQRNDGSSPLLMAAQYGQQRVLELLLTHGANPHLPNKYNSGPMYAACWWGHVGAVARLLRAGADVNQQTISKWTPLHKASQMGHLELAGLLIEAGAQVNALNSSNSSPLHTAAENGHAKVAQRLLMANAAVNAQDELGNSPLHRAAKTGQAEVIKVLLRSGADPSLKNEAGEIPLAVAAGHCNQPDVLDLLLSTSNPDGYIEAGIAAACCYGRGDNALRLLRGIRKDTGALRSMVPQSCAQVASECLRRITHRMVAPVSFASANPSREATDSQFSQYLFKALCRAGFTIEGAAVQQAEADILQIIVSRLKPGTCINVVGSFSEGWGSSLKSLNGKIDKDSDIDFTEILAVELHIEGYCKCESPDPDKVVKYQNGHVQYPVATANPSNPQFRTMESPAMDYVNALRLCCYPHIEVLVRTDRQTHIPEELLQSLRSILKDSLCHVVRAAPPGIKGDWLRLSTTFLERHLIRGFNTVQGQLFVILKFLIKRHLSKKVCGLKTYVAKTLMFRMMDVTPTDDWHGKNLLELTRRALELLANSLQHGGEDECMPHFFVPDAVLYLRKDHSPKTEILEALRITLCDLRGPLQKLMEQLTPVSSSSLLLFHPFTLVPVTYDLHSISATLNGSAIDAADLYPLVWALLKDLATGTESVLAAIANIPDCAVTVKETLTAVAQLKMGQQDAALQTLRAAIRHKVSRGFNKGNHVAASVTGGTKNGNWPHLIRANSIWRFCFRYDKRPDLTFLPKFTQENFPWKMQHYGNRFYVNFDALLKCLCLELIQPEVETLSRRWFVDMQHAEDMDVPDLVLALRFCTDPEILSGLIHKQSDVIAALPVVQKLLENCTLRVPDLKERCIRRTLVDVSHQLRQEAGARVACRRRRRRSRRLSKELPLEVH